MKYFSFLTLFLLAGVTFCAGQGKPTAVTKSMFHTETDDLIPLSELDGWFFRQGNDTAWARTDINMAGWQKLRPKELSEKNADKNGRVECWFRIKIKPDNTVNVKGLSIGYRSYAAADIYVNGKLIGSRGHTGLFGHPYAEYDATLLDPGLPFNLKPGDQFTLAVHLVDTLAPLGHTQLKSQVTDVVDLIYLINPDTHGLFVADVVNSSKRNSTLLAVCLTLCILFWLMAFQNRSEKVFFYIAWCSAFFVSFVYFNFQGDNFSACRAFIINNFLGSMSLTLFLMSVPVVIAKVFKRRLLSWVKIVLAAFVAFPLAYFYLQWTSYLSNAVIILPAGVSIYFIVSSWRNVKGAQLCIVGGSVGSFFFLLCYIVAFIYFPNLGTWPTYFIFLAFLLSFPVSLLVYVAMRFKEIINEVRANAAEVVQLSEEKREEALNRQRVLEEAVNRQTAEIRSNQARLIQSEKMASLGELTAGIAHEIQNPLNFVNNFSEVNKELLAELKLELAAQNYEEVNAIANDVIGNEEKISHHGKRADFIVKGMLEHSRTNTGEKQLTDMNVLCDEFLKLSFHGLRAKDKSFNAEMITHFDAKLPKVNVSQQDMGRVMLNLFNNAFYAVNQKVKTAGADYKPTVEVSTSIAGDQMLISVKDNGNGIPDAIKDKIMQPFFTTKPTGEGTGLGLSLSYDIVVKGHGGSIAVETTEGDGCRFIITLPTSQNHG